MKKKTKNEKKVKSLTSFFLREKPTNMLIQLKKNERKRYASVLAKEVDCTYSHTVRILQELEKRGLITFDKRGRLKVITLTKEGSEIATVLQKLLSLLDK